MLSIQAIKNAEYYLALAIEDYYLHGGEPEGRWLGNGARRLRLGPTVTADQLRQLMKGFAPDGKSLVKNAGFKNRQAGWDLTFSAPKSVSVLWANCTRKQQKRIQRLHFTAVKRALKYLEQNVARSRVGHAGELQIPADLVVATFEHGTSRALDPQLHTHALVLNLGVRPDGTPGTILSHPFYEHKMLAGALYRLELAAGLRQEMGLKLTPKKTWFEIEGVPEQVLKGFSTRRQQIERQLAKLGIDTASAAAMAALQTREKKDIVPPRQELFQQWQEQSRELGFSQRKAMRLVRESNFKPNVHRLLKEALGQAVDSLEEHNSHFTGKDILLETAHALQASGVSVDQFLPAIETERAHSTRLVSLGVRNYQRHYSTQRILDAERNLLKTIEKLSNRCVKPIPTKSLDRMLASPLQLPETPAVRITLREDQADAVRHLASGTSSLRVVSGLAGTGKTAMLLATRKVFESHGYQVFGVTPTHRARKELAKGAGIDTDTLAMRLLQFESARQSGKTLTRRGKGTQPVHLNSKSIVVLDEASMVDTLTFDRLLQHVERSGARLLVVGDEKQLPPVGPGGVFDELVSAPDVARLEHITRQKEEWSRLLVHDLSQGRPENFLRQHALRGQLSLHSVREEAEQRLVEDWRNNGGVEQPHRHIIATTTNAQVDRFNDLAQQERLAAGQLDAHQCLEVENEKFYVGDRVTFQKNARRLKVFNGDVGTVVAIRDWGFMKAVAVQLDGDEPSFAQQMGKKVWHHATQLLNVSKGKFSKPYVDQETRLRVIPIRSAWSETYCDLRRAYAFTTHKLQGSTVDHVYVSLGDAMTDRELTYVQGSRHRETLSLYTTEDAAGPLLTELVRHPVMPDEKMKLREGKSPLSVVMEKSRKKELATRLAIEVAKKPNIQPKPNL